MSTISEALKKVQQQRHEGQPGPPHGGGGHGGGSHDRPVAAWGDGRLLFPSILAGVAVMFTLLFYILVWHGSSVRYEDDALFPGVTPAGESESAVPFAPEAESSTPAAVRSAASTGAFERAGPWVPPEVRPQAPRPVLGGIFYAERNPVAIINGSSLKEGETADHWRVVKILPLAVELKGENETIELRLK